MIIFGGDPRLRRRRCARGPAGTAPGAAGRRRSAPSCVLAVGSRLIGGAEELLDGSAPGWSAPRSSRCGPAAQRPAARLAAPLLPSTHRLEPAAAGRARGHVEPGELSPSHPPRRRRSSSASGWSRYFGGVRALDDLTLTISAGELVGLVGPNGSGKTTLVNLLSGTLRPTHGVIRIAGNDIAGLAPHRVAHAGVARTYQIPRPFPSMTVRDNVAMAIMFGRDPRPLARGQSGGPGAPRLRRPRPSRRRLPRRDRTSTSASCWRWPGRSPPTRRCCCSTRRWPD